MLPPVGNLFSYRCFSICFWKIHFYAYYMATILWYLLSLPIYQTNVVSAFAQSKAYMYCIYGRMKRPYHDLRSGTHNLRQIDVSKQPNSVLSIIWCWGRHFGTIFNSNITKCSLLLLPSLLSLPPLSYSFPVCTV